MKANFGILPPLEAPSKGRRNKRQRAEANVARALADLETLLTSLD